MRLKRSLSLSFSLSCFVSRRSALSPAADRSIFSRSLRLAQGDNEEGGRRCYGSIRCPIDGKLQYGTRFLENGSARLKQASFSIKAEVLRVRYGHSLGQCWDSDAIRKIRRKIGGGKVTREAITFYRTQPWPKEVTQSKQ